MGENSISFEQQEEFQSGDRVFAHIIDKMLDAEFGSNMFEIRGFDRSDRADLMEKLVAWRMRNLPTDYSRRHLGDLANWTVKMVQKLLNRYKVLRLRDVTAKEVIALYNQWDRITSIALFGSPIT